ncbi:MAG: amino acid adenylation domain-containing protein, partial [Deltaproteobacteria bacterium]|nr:amino acid adenylation domain-containing protein [Deltaproteobacteria bacterium]
DPKGIEIEHRGLVNYITWAIRYYDIEGRGSFPLYTSMSFDLTVTSLFVPLVAGERIEVQPTGVDPSTLIEAVMKSGSDIAKLTPAHLEILNDLVSSGVEKSPQLNRFILGGEALSPVVSRSLLERYPDLTFYNEYGPAETVVGCIVYKFNELDPDCVNVPIGKPIANTKAYILDKDLNLVPIGVPGEICISSPGVARGYLNKEEMTSESFVPNPFISGERIYRTGDLGRWLSDGNMEFLGRIDHQIKMRGYRIELEEVEAILARYEGIRDCVVVDRDDVIGNKYLVGYYVSGDDIPITDLRAYLKESLPEYMVPSRFMRMESLPLTPNGKVDRKALPEPEGLRPDMESEYVAPRNEVEEIVADIWKEILGLDKVGIHDNFFDLGGHSLKVTQVVSRIRKKLGVDLPVRSVFEEPTIEGLCRVIASLDSSEYKYRQIEVLPKQDYYKLSHAQKRLWFLDHLMPGTATYNLPMAVVLEGDLDVGAMRDALQVVVDRHESLRTIFKDIEGEPVQVIVDDFKGSLDVTNLAGTSKDDLREVALEEVMRPFDLSKGPLFRAKLFKISDTSYLFVFTMHHIISDGWSMEILIKEVVSSYIALSKGEEPDFPELRIQYKDFAYWQNKLLEDGSLKDQEEYWLKKLGGKLPVLDLPTDRPRPPIETQNGSVYKFTIDSKITSKIKGLMRDRDVTLFMMLLASLDVLFMRLTRQEDIIIGSPVAGRNHHDVEDLIGFFVNTIALRTDLSGNPSFIELLDRVKQTCLGAYANQDYPFDKLIDLLNPVRDTSRSPIFNVLFVLQNEADIFSVSSVGGITFKGIEEEQRTAKFDLSLYVSEFSERLEAQFEYNTDLFNKDTIQRISNYFSNLLSRIIESPEKGISEYEVLSKEEKEKILIEFNNTDSEFPRDKCPYQLFEEQVNRTPDKVAVSFDDNSLTYRELNEKANQLAHYLRKKGVGKETMIGLMLERSLDMIIGILGIQKAGGAYIPMDPEYPRPRLEYMLEDTKAPVLVTQSALLNRLSNRPSSTVVLDTDWDKISREPKDNLPPLSTQKNLSHIIYTSGSTGTPKGVMIEHKNVTAFLYWCMEEFSFDEYEKMIASTSICFDLSVFEFFLPLITGAQVIILRSSLDIDDYLKNYAATMINTVPSALKHFLSVTNTRHHIKAINLAGEPLKLDLVQNAYEKLDVDIVRNLYGPTEDTTYSTNFRVPRDSDRQPLIGRPISNTKAYILDKYLNPVPIGVIGEIYLAGAGIARGYLNAPEKTTQRFIPNPFSILEGNYLYRTGDLGRYLPDGNIEFLGRVDYQVKIRGNRIELGEIEARLSTYEGISDCVVVDKDDEEGDKYLVAYYVSESDVFITDVRAYLKETLPEYMVPSRFVHLDALPLTPNGKIDRKALPEPEGLRPEMKSIYTAPRNDIERTIAEVWENVLGIDKVGIHDNFFDLGGHSLLIMKILAKMQLKYPIGVQDFFDYQTVKELAQIIFERMENLGITKPEDTISEIEIESDKKIDIEVSGLKETPKNILLTGATGYLGSHLLYELLLRTDARIYCLVRDDNEEQIRKKLQDSLDFYFAGKEVDGSRIRPILGNLEQDGLALSEGVAKELSEEIDTIIHTAADVRHFGEYEHFRNINVHGTERLLRLAVSGRCRRFHHISTLSIIGDYIPNMDQVVFKETDYDRGQKLDNVYARSKFEAEGLVRDAISQGLPATIYRVGNLVGDSITGQFQRSIETNAFYGLLKALLHMGLMPDTSDGLIDLTPIDSCSEAMVELMLLPETAGQTMHVYNPYQISPKDLAGMLQSIGYSIEIISPEDYLSSIHKVKTDSEKGEVLEKLVPHISATPTPKTRVIYDNRIAMHFLKATGFKWPKLDGDLIDNLIKYCVDIGFIKPPVEKEEALSLGDPRK